MLIVIITINISSTILIFVAVYLILIGLGDYIWASIYRFKPVPVPFNMVDTSGLANTVLPNTEVNVDTSGLANTVLPNTEVNVDTSGLANTVLSDAEVETKLFSCTLCRAENKDKEHDNLSNLRAMLKKHVDDFINTFRPLTKKQLLVKYLFDHHMISEISCIVWIRLYSEFRPVEQSIVKEQEIKFINTLQHLTDKQKEIKYLFDHDMISAWVFLILIILCDKVDKIESGIQHMEKKQYDLINMDIDRTGAVKCLYYHNMITTKQLFLLYKLYIQADVMESRTKMESHLKSMAKQDVD
jgi:hypothetical protein